MDKERFNEIIIGYGKEIYLNKPEIDKKRSGLNIEEYPIITMREIAIKILEEIPNKDIEKKFYNASKSCEEFLDMLNSFHSNIISNKEEVEEFVDYLIGKQYPIGDGFNMEFKKKESGLEIIIENK